MLPTDVRILLLLCECVALATIVSTNNNTILAGDPAHRAGNMTRFMWANSDRYSDKGGVHVVGNQDGNIAFSFAGCMYRLK